MTTINELQVHDGWIVANVSDATEIRLDGWNRYRPILEFSWYDPWLIVGSTEKPLKDGARTLTVRGPSGEDSHEFVMGEPEPAPEPEPEPEPAWKPLLDLSKRSAWDGIHESAPGAKITDEPDGSIRLYKPKSGERCEVSHHDERIGEGGTYRYSWDVRIDPITKLSTDGSGTDTINQQHGDQKSGYGGGLTVRASDKKLILRVKGGKRLSSSGSQRYEYESDGKGGSDAEPASNVEVGTIKVGERQSIVVEARWSKVWDGFVRVSLDGGPWVGVKDVPTMCEPANVQMFYLGWYSSDGPTPKDMKVWDAKVEVAA